MGRSYRFRAAGLILTAFFTSTLGAFGYESKYVDVYGVSNADEVEQECDRTIEKLNARYGKPENWIKFPVYFRGGGGSIAGYCSHGTKRVNEVVIYLSFQSAKDGTLSHELTHAFLCYYLQNNINLFLNEGTAQNSETKNRRQLRESAYRVYNANNFSSFESLLRSDRYDPYLHLYYESFSLVDFLIGKGGSSWFIDFFYEATNSGGIERALKNYYGYDSLGELKKDWFQYIESGQDRNKITTLFEEVLNEKQ